MLLQIQFTGMTLLVTILLSVPFIIYVKRSKSWGKVKKKIDPAENPLNFDDLAAVDNATQSQSYLDALNWALCNPEINNIAITGPYGSGKSSILKTFKKTYPDKFNYLNISLASFTDQSTEHDKVKKPKAMNTEESETEEERKNEAQQLIELSVLQQIFYKVDENAIPDSRFKRISSMPEEAVWHFSAGALAALFSLIFLIFPQQAKKLTAFNEFSSSEPDLWMLFLIAMLSPGLIWVITYLIRFFRNTGLKKLNISSGEIEINPKSEASILNRYLDELVYFFSVTKYNVVMIEDMDRFNDPEIFTKLRELNTLLNSTASVGRTIVFVYAIRDDLFPDERTRTKFFEFIIPVIPVINWSNSLQKLKEKLDKAGLKIHPRFITSITLYIDDMRVLKNVFNELMLYKTTLDIPVDRQTKLLAMIAYKNIYPTDFARLHDEQGIVHNVFKTAQDVRAELVADIDGRIEEHKELIKKVNEQLPYNLRELRAPYIQAIIDKLLGFHSFYIGGETNSFADLQGDTLFDQLRSGKDIFYSRTTGERTAVYNFAEVESTVAPGQTYAEREFLVRQKTTDGANELKRELDRLIAEREKIETYSVTDIIQKKTGSFPQLDESNNENRLLRYLIREGYIDSSYPYLISYFYPGHIGRSDMNFITYINDRIPQEFDYKLDSPSGLIDMLEVHDFESDVIFNLQLLNTLLKNRPKYKTQGDKVIVQLNHESQRSLEFISAYIDKGKQVPVFIKLLCKRWYEIFSFIVRQKNNEQTQKYLALILKHCDTSDLDSLNFDNALSGYLNMNFIFLSDQKIRINAERLAVIISSLDLKFKELSAKPVHELLFELAYEGNHYQLTEDNIYAIIGSLNTNKLDLLDLKIANYSTIQNSNCENLVNYVDQEASDYVEQVLLKLKGSLHDLPTHYKELLNDEDLHIDQKKKIILLENEIMPELEMVEHTELYPMMLENSKVSPTWKNVLFYFERTLKIDAALLAFFDEHENAKALGMIPLEIADNPDSKLGADLEKAIMLNDDININSYHLILKAFDDAYTNLDTNVISEEKVSALLDNDLLHLTPENYNRLKAKNPPLHIRLIQMDPETFFANIEDFELDTQDRLWLLDDKALKPSDRIKLLGTIDEDMIGESPELADRVMQVMVQHNTLNIDKIKLTALITHGTTEGLKLQLFAHHLPALNINEIATLLTGIGGDYVRLNSKGRPKFRLDELHLKIGGILESKHVISKPKIDQEKGTIKMVGIL